MGFFDNIKDWASKKLASTEFVTYVDKSTAETLLAPNYDMFMVLVDAANDPKGEWVADVVRSVRVRLDNPNPKVKFFTLELISVLVQNCGLKFHSELAESKGCLNAIVETACLRENLVRGPLAEARRSAIQLIVNLDVWFKHHPSREKVAPLADLINDAKARGAVFENVVPDTTTQIITEKYPRRAADTHRSGQEILHANAGVPAYPPLVNAEDHGVPNTSDRRRADAPGYPGGRATQAQRRQQFMSRAPLMDEVVIVEAIPCEEPDEARRSGMFDAVMLLGECFHAAVAAREPIHGNEMISNVASQVQDDFLQVSMLVHSGAVLEGMETLASLYESQRTMLRQVREAQQAGGGAGGSGGAGGAGGGPSPAAGGSASAAARPAGATTTTTTTSAAPAGAARPPVAQSPAKQPAGKSAAAAPTLDELFASSAPAPPPPPPQTANFPGDLATTLMTSDGSPLTARRSALPEPRQSMTHGQRNTVYAAGAGELVDQELHSPKEGPDPSPAAAPAAFGGGAARGGSAARTAADTDNGDFDAFLNARLSIQN